VQGPAPEVGCIVSHVERERAKLYDRQAKQYDRSRSGYPDALIDQILGSSPHRLSVLDVACGTGIASRLMAERGARVLGVELNAGMAEIAERHGIPTEVAAFETWDPAGRTFDRVTCAQAWQLAGPRRERREDLIPATRRRPALPVLERGAPSR
jgi:2-polyprenyl-3-methyl-5-hydroxy-6-metoxy-1,4-benzoquinol methylase